MLRRPGAVFHVRLCNSKKGAEEEDVGWSPQTPVEPKYPAPWDRVAESKLIVQLSWLCEKRRFLELVHDFIVFDTPGRDDPLARHVATRADTLVTPLNDSFVDFDLIGQVDAETFKVRRLSFYAELIWEARKKRAMTTIREARREMDWVVVRNRTQHIEARNQRRIDQALVELSKRVGFRIASGLSERVIYRELFPSGLTLLDKGHLGELGTSHLVARQELRSLVAGLNLPMPTGALGAHAGTLESAA